MHLSIVFDDVSCGKRTPVPTCLTLLIFKSCPCKCVLDQTDWNCPVAQHLLFRSHDAYSHDEKNTIDKCMHTYRLTEVRVDLSGRL